MLWVILEIMLFMGIILGQGVIQELKEKEKSYVNERVYSHRSYVEKEMLKHWMNVDSTVHRINEKTEAFIKEMGISVKRLEEEELSAALLEELTPNLIAMLRRNQVSSAFLVLNTENLAPSEEIGQYHKKQGVYLRNTAPGSRSKSENADLRLLRAPENIAAHLNLPTDSFWKSEFDFENYGISYYDFLYRPSQAAYLSERKLNWSDYGCWTGPLRLHETNQDVLCYSVPLMISDGSVYAVLGVDVSESCLKRLLSEGDADGESSYFIGLKEASGRGYQSLMGKDLDKWYQDVLKAEAGKEGKYYVREERLALYDRDMVFSGDEWVLGIAAPYSRMYRFVYRFETMLSLACVLSLLLGLLGCLALGYEMQLPISRLLKDMESRDSRSYVELEPTGITEIDHLSGAIESMSHELLDYGRRFSQILKMASTGIGGIMIDQKQNDIYVSEDFFPILGMTGIDPRKITIPEFYEKMRTLKAQRPGKGDLAGGFYRVFVDGEKRYVRLRVLEKEEITYGLVEDVTEGMLEKRVLTYERDHDTLTGLLNRGAFWRKLKRMFEKHRSELGIGLFFMIDLDNLKYVNDSYGHDYGDLYIQRAARVLDRYGRGKGLCARISGDEFQLFLYGFPSQEAAIRRIEEIQEEFQKADILLLDGNTQKVKASGGVAIYPSDSTDCELLSRYADHAMYRIKKSSKGEIGIFDKSAYEKESMDMGRGAELTHLLSERQVFIAMQPIVSAESGEIFGYEALMRSSNPAFHSLLEILETAKREGKLNQIEELSWTMALPRFVELKKRGIIPADSRVFINSISNQKIRDFICEDDLEKYLEYCPDVVLEVTEEEEIDSLSWEAKMRWQKRLGWKIALDDYGTGYNGHKRLLEIDPDYVKIDQLIVRDIQEGQDKQDIFRSVVKFAHERGKCVIAEGIETKEELETVIQLGANYLQGFFLAQPERIPKPLSGDIASLIRELSKREGEPEAFEEEL